MPIEHIANPRSLLRGLLQLLRVLAMAVGAISATAQVSVVGTPRVGRRSGAQRSHLTASVMPVQGMQ